MTSHERALNEAHAQFNVRTIYGKIITDEIFAERVRMHHWKNKHTKAVKNHLFLAQRRFF